MPLSVSIDGFGLRLREAECHCEAYAFIYLSLTRERSDRGNLLRVYYVPDVKDCFAIARNDI